MGSNLISLKGTSHSQISPDTYVVSLSNLSTATLSVISILYHFSFIIKNYQYLFIFNLRIFLFPLH